MAALHLLRTSGAPRCPSDATPVTGATTRTKWRWALHRFSLSTPTGELVESKSAMDVRDLEDPTFGFHDCFRIMTHAIQSAEDKGKNADEMVAAAGGGLTLSPAQRLLAEKGAAGQRARDESAAIQRAVDSATRPHAVCSLVRGGGGGGHSLIIRHVGEQLARVAKLHCAPKNSGTKKSELERTSAAVTTATPARARSADTVDAADSYDDERFGPVRRPPRARPPNLWVSIFEKEQADVQREHEDAARKRLADAAQYRRELAQQQAGKQALRRDERARADAFAAQQAQQTAAWRAQEAAARGRQHAAMADEAARCQQELQRAQQQLLAAQQARATSELRAVARANALLAAEAREKERRKQQQREDVARVQQANAALLERKREAAAREQDEDRALQRVYEEKLAQQDAQRRQALAAIVDKQSRRVRLALLNVPSAEEKAREDEARAAAVQERMRAREEEELRRRAARKQEATRVQAAALQQQRGERADKAQREQAAEDAYAAACTRDQLAWQQQARDAQTLALDRDRAHQALVRRQMARDVARRADEDAYGMSREEMALNAALLRRAGVAQLPLDAPPS
ncbi:hypothetical protein PybrP1_012409 [[Pythium] brassicae (nom. inval.)]|nr:hypothetical protein PybrP1_012409 [[Pythium] brassicae (nom. inval.)]